MSGPPWLADAAEALGLKGQALNWNQVLQEIRALRRHDVPELPFDLGMFDRLLAFEIETHGARDVYGYARQLAKWARTVNDTLPDTNTPGFSRREAQIADAYFDARMPRCCATKGAGIHELICSEPAGHSGAHVGSYTSSGSAGSWPREVGDTVAPIEPKKGTL